MIRTANEKDYPAITEIWEQSVRATHHFLPEDYLQYIKSILPSILPEAELYVYEDALSGLAGFVGVAENKIEMLFIHPNVRGIGIGRLLTQFAVDHLNAIKLDVNEQNEQAVGFYQKMNFKVTGRSEMDGSGKTFPLLHMEQEGIHKIAQ